MKVYVVNLLVVEDGHPTNTVIGVYKDKAIAIEMVMQTAKRLKNELTSEYDLLETIRVEDHVNNIKKEGF